MSDEHSARCRIGECWSQRHVLDGWSADAERYAMSEARAILAESESGLHSESFYFPPSSYCTDYSDWPGLDVRLTPEHAALADAIRAALEGGAFDAR